VGNPVAISTGAKVQSETDLAGAASDTLVIRRTYRALANWIKSTSGGNNWSFSFDRSFRLFEKASDDRPTLIAGTQGDGAYFRFDWSAASQKYISKYDKVATLEALDASYDDWLLTQDGQADRYQKRVVGDTETFVLVSSQRLTGSLQTYTYIPNTFLIQDITDERGRKLELSWGANNQVASITSPEGSVHYSYDSPWGNYSSFGQMSRLISVSYFDKSGASATTKQYHYEDLNNPFLLTGVTDENGNRYATYAYDNSGRTVLSEHADGANRYSFAYPDSSNRIITDPLGAQRTLGLRYINNTGLIKSASQPGGSGCAGGSQDITHDSRGNIVSQVDFNGNRTCYQRDTRGLQTVEVSGLLNSDTCPTSDTAPLGNAGARRVSTRWHPDFPLRTAVAEANRITTYLYNGQRDAAGKLAECAPGATLPNGKPLPLLCSTSVQATTDVNGADGFSGQPTGTARVWNFTYYANGQLLTSISPMDASGRTAAEIRTYYQDTSATHRAGDLATITNAGGETTQYLEYSPTGLATIIRRPNGQIVTLHYGSAQRLARFMVDDGSGAVERNEFIYDAVGNLTRSIAPDGSSVSYTYDSAHRLTDVIDSAGNRRHFDLDSMGNVVKEQQFGPEGDLAWNLTRSFDLLNRLQFQKSALQANGTSYEYDRNGNLTNLIDELGRRTPRQYDRFNRLTREEIPIPYSTTSRHLIYYTYNQQDQLLTVRDPKQLITRYTVDGFDQRTQVSSPDTGLTSSVFDNAGNLVSITDARGTTTNYAYDISGRVTRAGTTTFQYGLPNTTAAGQLIGIFDGGISQTTFNYDGFGRITKKTQLATPNSTRTGLQTFVTSFVYGKSGTDTGHLTSMTYPSGSRLDISYDSAGRPSNLYVAAPGAKAQIVLIKDIIYHPLGYVGGWTWGNSTGTNPNKYARQFDLEEKLVSYPLGNINKAGATRTLHYDEGRRIVQTTHVGAANASSLDQLYSYDNLDRLISFVASDTSQSFRYDQNGNRYQATFGSSTYTNTFSSTSNRLNATTGPAPSKSNDYDAAGNLVSDGTISYYYDSNGRMQTATTGGVTTRYGYNGRGERLFKTSPSVTSHYVYDEQGHLLGEYDGAGKPLQETIYLGDTPVAVLTPATTGLTLYYVYTDHLQAPRVLTRASDDQIVWRWDHADPFGLNQPDENPSNLGRFIYNLRFPGQIYDKETNNHYNYYRDYDPQTGRYVQSDPIGLLGGLNTYGYVGGNPVTRVDPLGLWAPGAHNHFIDVAFRTLDPAIRDIIKNGSAYADTMQFQDPTHAHMHAMSSSSGMAMHPVMDSTSPAHAGFQRWNGIVADGSKHGPFPTSLEKESIARQPGHTKNTVDAMNRAMAGDLGGCGCE
jgi:RHS repeat-associated protein